MSADAIKNITIHLCSGGICYGNNSNIDRIRGTQTQQQWWGEQHNNDDDAAVAADKEDDERQHRQKQNNQPLQPVVVPRL